MTEIYLILFQVSAQKLKNSSLIIACKTASGRFAVLARLISLIPVLN